MARDEAKWAYWGKHVKDWRASGITRHSYCRREGLKPTTFDYWRPLISLDRPEVKPQKPSVTSKRVTLVPVTVIDRPRDAAREFSPVKDALILKSPSGWQVQLSAQTDPNWLINVLRQLPRPMGYCDRSAPRGMARDSTGRYAAGYRWAIAISTRRAKHRAMVALTDFATNAATASNS